MLAKTEKGQKSERKMEEIIKNRPTEQLKEMATLLMSNYEDGATFAFIKILDELEIRLSEAEYVAFCDSL